MASRALVELLISARNTAGSVIRGFGDQLGSAKVAVAGLAAALAGLFGGIAIGKFFGDALASARSFEEQMSIVAAKSGATAQELELLSQAAQEMGSATRFSATEAAQGLEILATAGVSATDSVKLLPTVLQVAQGAGISLAESAGILTDSLGILGASIDDAGELADVLSKGALLANTSVSQLGQALKVAGGSARAAGLDLQQTTAALDALANNGVKSAEAGTALRNLLNELRNPASAARAALLQLGITTGDLPTILKRLEGNTAGVSRVLDALTVDAQVAGRALFNVGATGFAEFDRKLREAQGTAQQTADVMDQNLNGALRGLSSAFDGFRQALVRPLLEPITQQVKDLAAAIQQATTDGTIDRFRDSLVAGFNTAVQAVRDFIAEFDFQAALTALGEFTESASQKLTTLVNTGRGLADTLRIIVGSFEAIVSAGAAAVEKAGSLSLQTLERLPGPLSLITKQIAGAFESVALGSEDLDRRSREHFNSALESISGIGTALDRIATGYDKAGDSQRRAAQAQQEAATAAREAAVAQEAVNQAQTEAIPNIERIIDGTERLNQSLDDAGRQAGVMSDELKEAFKTLGLDTQQELELVRDTAKNLFDELKKSGTGTAEDLKRAFLAYAEAAREAAELSTDAAKEALEAELAREAAALGIAESEEKKAEATKKNTDALREQIRTYEGLIGASREAADAKDAESEATERANSAHRGAIPIARENTIAWSLLGDAARAAYASIEDGTHTVARQVSELEQTRIKVSEFTESFKRLKEITGAEFGGNFGAIIELMDRYAEQLQEASALQERFTAGVQDGSLSLAQMEQIANRVDTAFDLLDDAQLEPLRRSIAQARSEFEALADAIESRTSSLQDQLDRLRGNEAAVVERDIDRQRRELEDLLERARFFGTQQQQRELEQAIRNLEEIQKFRLQQIEEAARRQDELARQQRPREETADRPPTGRNAPIGQPITFNVNGVLDEKLVRRDVIPILNQVLRRSA